MSLVFSCPQRGGFCAVFQQTRVEVIFRIEWIVFDDVIFLVHLNWLISLVMILLAQWRVKFVISHWLVSIHLLSVKLSQSVRSPFVGFFNVVNKLCLDIVYEYKYDFNSSLQASQYHITYPAHPSQPKIKIKSEIIKT